MIYYTIMENNIDIRRKFKCYICGDVMEQERMLLSVRCDKCLYKPIQRNINDTNIKLVCSHQEDTNSRDV